MKKRKWMAVLLGLALVFGIPAAQAEVQVKPASPMRADFIKGADVSKLGVFYWEPDWIVVPGCGAGGGWGNGWENLAMFDKNGKALSFWKVFETK